MQVLNNSINQNFKGNYIIQQRVDRWGKIFVKEIQTPDFKDEYVARKIQNLMKKPVLKYENYYLISKNKLCQFIYEMKDIFEIKNQHQLFTHKDSAKTAAVEYIQNPDNTYYLDILDNFKIQYRA